MDLCIISTLFFGMFSYLSAPLVLVFFCNPSIRKHVFCKSDGSKIRTFSMCFVGFVPSLFFSRFSLIFDAIRGSMLHYFSEKNRSGNHFKKRRPPNTNKGLCPCPEAPWQPPSRAHFSNKKQEFELEMLFEFVSMPLVSKNWSEMVVWVGFNCKFIKNKIEKLKRSMYYPEGFAPCDLTRPGQRPGELFASVG